MGQHILGGYTFDFDPDTVGLPEAKKTVSRAATYGGSAIFEWDAIMQGTTVELTWDWMYWAQYRALRRLYLQTGVTFNWSVPGGSVYEVAIIDMGGNYLKNFGPNTIYRKNVKLLLDIRSVVTSATTTTTTTEA